MIKKALKFISRLVAIKLKIYDSVAKS